jgi:hypothetical protein
MADVKQLPSDNKMRDYYSRFGLEPEASIRDVEAAYWRVARELKGQAAMAPFNEAYEALVNRGKPRALDVPEPEATIDEKADAASPRSPSKFGWPSN